MTLQLLEQPTQRAVTLYGVSWEQFEIIESALSGIARVRLTYLDETLDIMAPLSPEPDESYNLETKKDVPDIAIEVVITSGGVDKLTKYARWRVPEVWFWEKGQLFVYHLREQEYEEIPYSEFLSELDLDLLVSCANMSDQYDAVTEFALRVRN